MKWKALILLLTLAVPVGLSQSIVNGTFSSRTTFGDGRIFSFALISDWHSDYSDWFETSAGEPADNMRFINTLSPRFMVDCGDELWYGGSQASNGLYAASNMFSTNLTVPHYHIPGNHDGWIEYGWTNDYWANIMGEKHFYFSNWPCAFIGFQSKKITQAGISNDYGYVESDELAWVETQLQAATNARLKPILFVHHPVVNGTHALPIYPTYGGTAVSNLCVDYGVPLVFSGHEHWTNIVYSYTAFTNVGLPSLAQDTGALEGVFNIVVVYTNSLKLNAYLASPSKGYPAIPSANRTLLFSLP